MRILRYGPDAVLLELADLEAAQAVRDLLLAARQRDELIRVIDVVPAARTVGVLFEPGHADPAALGRLLRNPTARESSYSAREITIPVVYDGADLELVAETAGMSPQQVIQAHSEAHYRVAFTGFAPGFGYLSGLPPALHQPRLARPRTRVPQGSVAIADEFSAVYPGASPGGWRLIGRTDTVLFDPRAADPALLRPGDLVRFAARETLEGRTD
ncbi:MAG: 5-oxoprolinase subunit PxpB, partial [Sciscionella sp.]